MLTIEECRQILGKNYDRLSDKQIENIRDLFANVCSLMIHKYERGVFDTVKQQVEIKENIKKPTLNKEWLS